MKNFWYPALFLFLGIGLLFLDFASKAYVNALLPFVSSSTSLLFPEREVFSNFLGGIDFSIVLAYNKGIAWGLFSKFPILILICRLIVIVGLVYYFFANRKNSRMDFPFVFILAGAAGNVVDCLLYGQVVDFLKFDFWGNTFPIFNFADAFITIGVLLLIILNLIEDRKRNSKACRPSHP